MKNIKIKNKAQKGILALVVIMFITIPKMHVYSLIGSYETSSLAIEGNNNYELSSSISEKPVAPAQVLFVLGLYGAIMAGLGAIAGLALGYGSYGDSIPLITFDKNYDQYDFSQFDN